MRMERKTAFKISSLVKFLSKSSRWSSVTEGMMQETTRWIASWLGDMELNITMKEVLIIILYVIFLRHPFAMPVLHSFNLKPLFSTWSFEVEPFTISVSMGKPISTGTLFPVHFILVQKSVQIFVSLRLTVDEADIICGFQMSNFSFFPSNRSTNWTLETMMVPPFKTIYTFLELLLSRLETCWNSGVPKHQPQCFYPPHYEPN